MKYFTRIWLFSLLLFFNSCKEEHKGKVNNKNQVTNSSWDGKYFGIEKLEIDPPDESETDDGLIVNHSLNKLLIRDDSIFMDQLNAIIKDGDTLSGETLGSIYYSGQLTDIDSVKFGKLRLIGSNYIAFPRIKNPETGKFEEQKRKPLILKLQKTNSGLMVNGISYKKVSKPTFLVNSESRSFIDPFPDSLNLMR